MKSIIVLSILLAFTSHSKAQHPFYLEHTTVIGGDGAMFFETLTPTSDGGLFWIATTNDSSGNGDLPLCSMPSYQAKSIAGKVDSNGQKVWVKLYCDWQPEISNCPPGEKGYVMGGMNDPGPESDLNLTKLDCEGKVLWRKSWGSTRTDYTWKVIETSDGGYLMLGVSNGRDGDIPFNYRPPNSFIATYDIVVIKTDSLGNKEWLKVYGSSTEDYSNHVFQIGGFYYLLAYTDGYSNDHDFSDTTLYPGNSRGFLMKLNDTGGIVWNRSLGDIHFNDALFDTDDSTFVIASSAVHNTPPFYRNYGGWNADFGVAKYDLEGQLIWAKLYGDPDFKDVPTGIEKGADGTYWIVGESGIQLNPQPPRIGLTDGLMIQIDSVGNKLGEKFFGNTDYNTPDGLIRLGKGNKLLVMTQFNNTTNPFSEGTWSYSPGVKRAPTFSIFRYWPLSINETAPGADSLIIYPNPTKGSFTVRVPEQGMALKVSDMSGRIVAERKTESGLQTLDASGWASGTYIIEVLHKDGTKSRGLVQRVE